MPLRLSAIQRKLIFRLTVGSIVLSSMLGTAAFLYERRQLQEQVTELVRISIDLLRNDISRYLGVLPSAGDRQPDWRQFDYDLARNPPHTELGRFAVVVLYDASQREVGHFDDGSGMDVRRVTEILTSLQPGQAPTEIELAGVFHGDHVKGIPFALAIMDRAQAVGYLKGIFVPSSKTETDMLRAARRASEMAVLFVLVTALIIYPIIRDLVVKLEKQTVRLAHANIDTIRVLGSAIAKRDSGTNAHNYRVSIYSVRLAEAAGLGPKDIFVLLKGAFLHDVGKIGIPDAVLGKQGKLTEEETKLMRHHVQYGLDIVGNADWLADAADIVGCHHEKYDGSGYPHRLSGNAIPLTARIFAITDAFDALTSKRPYKPALSLEESLQILRQESGRQFDPELVSIFEPLAPTLLALVAVDPEVLPGLLGQVAKPYLDLDSVNA